MSQDHGESHSGHVVWNLYQPGYKTQPRASVSTKGDTEADLAGLSRPERDETRQRQHGSAHGQRAGASGRLRDGVRTDAHAPGLATGPWWQGCGAHPICTWPGSGPPSL